MLLTDLRVAAKLMADLEEVTTQLEMVDSWVHFRDVTEARYNPDDRWAVITEARRVMTVRLKARRNEIFRKLKQLGVTFEEEA